MIIHIVGNRPQFIKLAPLYRELKERGYDQVIIHTGQHYDRNMSDIFFDELNIPKPYINIGVGSGTHAHITANAILGVENACLKLGVNHEKDIVVLYGDTDSTLAAAIAIRKLGIRLVHVEGGARTATLNNPEEANRIVADHLSDIIFAPDNASLQCAQKEGIGHKTYKVGDIMYDTYMWFAANSNGANDVLKIYDINCEDMFVLMTWHRQENTDSKERMRQVLNFIKRIEDTVVCPLHPRTVKCLKQFGLWDMANEMDNFIILPPVGYSEMVGLLKYSKLVLTDSGGLSKESSYAGSKCLFMNNENIWPDLVDINWIKYVDPESEDSIDNALCFAKNARKVDIKDRPSFYGDGRTAKKIADILTNQGFI